MENIRENKFKKSCKRYEHIYIYGTGVYATKTVNLLEKEKMAKKIDGFIVSDGFKNIDTFEDKPVYEISQIKLGDKQAVALALNEENKKQVIPGLKELKIRYFEF
jgi:hypothetical protein